jgi:hypothetical protein
MVSGQDYGQLWSVVKVVVSRGQGSRLWSVEVSGKGYGQ